MSKFSINCIKTISTFIMQHLTNFCWLAMRKTFLYNMECRSFSTIALYSSTTASLFMVARSSVARARLPLEFLFFYSRHTFSDVAKPTSTKLSHTTWLSLQQNLCYTDFFKVPPKTNGAEKPKICTIFRAKSQTISSVIR